MRVVVLDTETTGLNRGRNGGDVASGHRIVEIGCVEIIDGRITGKVFHSYIQPGMGVQPKAVAVHGITDAFLKDKPTFKQVADEFVQFISGAQEIVIHNARFDVAFLDQEFHLLSNDQRPKGLFFVTDTLEIARELFPGEGNRLEDLCNRFGIRCPDGFHGALSDAKVLAEVYLNLIKL
jgi:DNA polymerase-3 subunit epsilon